MPEARVRGERRPRSGRHEAALLARRRLPNVVERRRRRPRLPWEGAISGSAHSRGVDCVMALQAPQQRLLVLLLRSPQG